MSIRIKNFKPDDKNFNRHTKKGMEELERSIEKVGVIESITVSNDDKIISGNARKEKISKVLGEEVEPIVVETDGKRPVVIKRTDIESETKEFYEAALLANTTAKHNINLDVNMIQEIAVEEYGIELEELELIEIENIESGKPELAKPKEESNKPVPQDQNDESDEAHDENTGFYNSMLSDCIYESDNEFEIPRLLIEKQAGKLVLPFAPWGADTRMKTGISTYHFYVDDYRFEAVWKNPFKVMQTGVIALVEPNTSIFDTTPIAYGLHQIYKKRWISRYFQECGILIYADLNVPLKFKEYNRMGIPVGYNAFFTRGYSDRLEYLKVEFEIAKDISGLQTPNFLVYGGGEKIRKFCIENSLVYVEQFMQNKKNG